MQVCMHKCSMLIDMHVTQHAHDDVAECMCRSTIMLDGGRLRCELSMSSLEKQSLQIQADCLTCSTHAGPHSHLWHGLADKLQALSPPVRTDSSATVHVWQFQATHSCCTARCACMVQVCTGVMLHGYPLVKQLCGELQVRNIFQHHHLPIVASHAYSIFWSLLYVNLVSIQPKSSQMVMLDFIAHIPKSDIFVVLITCFSCAAWLFFLAFCRLQQLWSQCLDHLCLTSRLPCQIILTALCIQLAGWTSSMAVKSMMHSWTCSFQLLNVDLRSTCIWQPFQAHTCWSAAGCQGLWYMLVPHCEMYVHINCWNTTVCMWCICANAHMHVVGRSRDTPCYITLLQTANAECL